MSCRRVAVAASFILAGCFLVAACSSDDSKPPASSSFGTGGAAGTAGSAGAAGEAGTAGNAGNAGTGGAAAGSAGNAGNAGNGGEQPDADTDASGGQAGDAAPDVEDEPNCGDGVAQSAEACDGTDLHGRTCADEGFDEGSLGCTSSCELDTSACSGTEKCFDGKTNDGDKEVDCDDPDCAVACADVCGNAPLLTLPASFNSSTLSHPDSLKAGCLTESGADVAYKVIANTGVLEVTLVSDANLALAVRTTCDQASSEKACSDYGIGAAGVETMRVPVQQGVPAFIVVDGSGAAEKGSFQLDAAWRPLVCGDFLVDPGETCDDGNQLPDDGCSATCQLEVDEQEPNNIPAQASSWSEHFLGRIDPSGDVDLVQWNIKDTGLWSLQVDVYDIGDGSCSKLQMDPFVEILGPDGTTVLASDDDSGDGFCSRAVAGNLGTGTYYVRLSAHPAAPPVWSYVMNIIPDVCGNNNQSYAEECDDGNVASGDGCSPSCKKE